MTLGIVNFCLLVSKIQKLVQNKSILAEKSRLLKYFDRQKFCTDIRLLTTSTVTTLFCGSLQVSLCYKEIYKCRNFLRFFYLNISEKWFFYIFYTNCYKNMHFSIILILWWKKSRAICSFG